MTFETVDLAFNALREFPNGATPKMIAPVLGWSTTRTSQMLGRLALYDIIDRVPDPESKVRNRNPEYRYSIRKRAA